MVDHAHPVVYRINAADIIADVNDAWCQFAVENGAPSLATDVVGKSLWDFIDGREVRRIYASLFQCARKRRRTLSVPFRCDSPDLYRAMRLFVTPVREGGIEIRATLEAICVQPLKLDVLNPSPLAHSMSLLEMCSWCKAILVGAEWHPIEKALEELRLLTAQVLPTITNGVCDSCLQEYLQD